MIIGLQQARLGLQGSLHIGADLTGLNKNIPKKKAPTIKERNIKLSFITYYNTKNMAPKPVPTALPSTYGLKQYYPMSSQTNPMASNYQIQSRPMSSQNTQLNAYGTPLYQSTPVTNRVVNTNPLTGKFPQNNPSPQPGPAPTPAEDPNQAIWNQIDNIYNESMGYAGQAESTLRANQPRVEADIEGQYQSGVKSAETQKSIADRELTGAETAAGTRQEDALSAGRRLYNELMMGGQQRFGGASSAGQAYGELTAREFQRGQAGTRNAFQQAMTKITELKSNLQDKFSTALFNLETQKNAAINEAKRAFDERILEINRMRAEAGQNKSAMRLEMLQNLRNQIYQINLASAQSGQQLAQQKAQQEQVLSQLESQANSAVTGGQQATSDLTAQTTFTPRTQLTINAPQNAPQQTYTRRRKEEEMTGYALPRREDLFV